MPSENKVNVRISNSDGLDGNFSGGNIGKIQDASESLTSNEVNAELDGVTNSRIQISGGNISVTAQNLLPLMKELVASLSPHLSSREQVDDLEDLANEVLEQANRKPEEKNVNKIQRLLQGIGGYIGVATLAVNHAEKIKSLFEAIQKLVLGQ